MHIMAHFVKVLYVFLCLAGLTSISGCTGEVKELQIMLHM